LPGQPGVLFANNVPSNVYALAVVCVSGDGPAEPHLFPAVVGGPLDAFGGSVAGSTGTDTVGGGRGPPGGETRAGGSGAGRGVRAVWRQLSSRSVIVTLAVPPPSHMVWRP